MNDLWYTPTSPTALKVRTRTISNSLSQSHAIHHKVMNPFPSLKPAYYLFFLY